MSHSTQSSSGSLPTTNNNPVVVEPVVAPAAANSTPRASELPREHGGRDGPEPTRFGDWEKGGRCIDF
jgi:hypothetical protein